MRKIYKKENRLIYADISIADQQYWEGHWGTITQDNYQQAYQGKLLSGLEGPLMNFLPKPGKILEAGCGTGQVVLALRSLGFEVEGVEWAENVVAQVNKIIPDLPIRSGDVTKLDVPDQTYSAVISLGVAEHRQKGPLPYITEAFRILEQGGLLLISVPYFHILRRLRYISPEPQGLIQRFYQYAFTPQEFRNILTASGFNVLSQSGYEFWFSLCEDFPFMKWFEQIPMIGPRLQGLFNRSSVLSNLAGHMVLFIAQRK